MGRYTYRLLTALIVSSACSGLTFYFFGTDNSNARFVNKDPIAVLVNHTNDVQRKPLARVIWESISKDTALYPGEAIRTTNVSEASIKFLKTGAIIELEPDSLVVLEENEDGIALDFLAGNLFVKGGKGGDRGVAGLKLKSGDKQIDLSNADLSLSKSDEGGVDMEVFSGKVESGGDLNVVKNQIEVIYPEAGEPVYIDTKKAPQVSFTFEKLPEGYKVFVERGERRSQLARLENYSTDGKDGKLTIPTKVGKFYWRLVAVPQVQGLTEKKSSVIRTQVIAKSPPIILAPEDAAQVVINKENPRLKIKWAIKSKLEDLIVEVAKDKLLKQKVVTKPLDGNVTFDEIEIEESGQYFWRITGYMKIKGKLEPVSSDIRSFNLKVGVDLIPPKLASPAANQRISFNQVAANGLYMSFEPVPGLDNYEVVVEKPPAKGKKKEGEDDDGFIRKKTSTSPLRLQSLAPGKYTWHIVSINDKGERSTPSEKRTFTIDEMPKVEWADGPDPAIYEYFTAKPQVMVSWNDSKQKDVVSWRARYAQSGFLDADTKWIPREKPVMKLNLKADGDYEFEVEALNKKGTPVARSTVKLVTVRSKPLLPAPVFAANLPELLKSTRAGNLSVEWEAVEGAKSYKVELRNKNGEVVHEKIVERNTASLNRLKPGDYQVFVRAIDKYERAGLDGDPREAKVPDKSNIKAPKIKAIKVK